VAARADLVPAEYVTVLSRLEDRVPPRPFEMIAREIERELGRPVGTVFDRLDPVPLGAASLAQVHHGRLRDGGDVAVKVLYPGIEATVQRDLTILPMLLAPLLRPEGHVRLEGVLDEIAASVPAELDLIAEGRNAERIAQLLAHRADVSIPAVVWEWTRRRVLVTEFIDGIKITDVVRLREAGIDSRAVARLAADVYAEQLFRAGVFHADPHPGNLLVLPGPRLALLDFGLVKELPDSVRRDLGELTQCFAVEDPAGVVAALRRLGFRTAHDDPASLLALGRLFLGTFRPGYGYADPRRVIEADRAFRAAAAVNPVVAVPADLTLVARVLATLSGLGKQLDSRVDVSEMLLRYV
jgi:predicted unusual protein kinase regulating ubiquinone biosynthesis (AarF/ABC1/UbiB family)